MEAGTAVHLGFAPDLTAVAAHDAPNRSQADAGAREIVRTVQALEHAEQPVCEAHVEAGAVVAHGERVGLARAPFERDQRLRRLGAVFPGVAQQVFDHDAQQRRVAQRQHGWLDVDLHFALGPLAAQVVGHVGGKLRQVYRLARQRL